MINYKRLAHQKEAQIDAVREALSIYFEADPDAPDYNESELRDAREALVHVYAIINPEEYQ